jgi:prolyl 4-hydroxylase
MSPADSPQLAAARTQDAAGLHAEAIDTLARATRAGDLQSMTELGHRLLVGDRAPLLPSEGLGLIVDAAKRGAARALARVAALTAAGAWLPQDWPTALQLLGEAAAAGDAAARGQLQSLQPTDHPPADWPALAARVRLDEWLRPAQSVPLHDNVHRVTHLAPTPVCAWLIGRARGRLEPARVYDSVSRTDLVLPMRSNTVANFNFASFDVVQFLVQARMALTCGYAPRHFEAPMVLHYEVGEQIQPHFDFIDAQAPDYAQQIRVQGQRMITFLLYLNDDYAGGETTFPELGIVNRGVAGDGLYFINAHPDGASDRRMLHTGSPPTAGEKWIVSQFVRSIALRP